MTNYKKKNHTYLQKPLYILYKYLGNKGVGIVCVGDGGRAGTMEGWGEARNCLSSPVIINTILGDLTVSQAP